MTRIIAGQAGSLPLRVPQGPTRPTSDRVREAIFSSLGSMVGLDGARVLDLFAGSGALGLEAASRGASAVVFVDNSHASTNTITHNLRTVTSALDHDVSYEVTKRSVSVFLTELAPEAVFDVVFIDPPYELGNDEVVDTLDSLTNHLSPDAVVVVERASKTPEPTWPGDLRVHKTKTYGDTTVYFVVPNR